VLCAAEDHRGTSLGEELDVCGAESARTRGDEGDLAGKSFRHKTFHLPGVAGQYRQAWSVGMTHIWAIEVRRERVTM
jgi:hypothetical protein